ncbi:MAG TPA: hypothetical protein PKY35_06430 [Candidatus Hydrogenedentes bacterium]|nr:hypothetical protein [Candidatus Hydrogenedentota bacterium]HOL76650.1 hypothetical protein [Candidatus Hydrogenedentota bacterium]HPO84483.1 hypothetical protein [Candidatus Hydrogenedentota bacterium]
MKSALKFLAVGTGLVLIALAIGGIFLSFQAERTLQASLEKALSYIFSTDVMIDKLEIAPLQKTIKVSGLTIANPPGFPGGTALGCESLTATFDVRSFSMGEPIINLLELKGVVVNVRHELGKGTNIQKLLDTLSEKTSSIAPNSPRAAKKKFLVRELRCQSAQAAASTSILPKLNPDVTIAPFTMTNLGEGQPIALADVCKVLLQTLLRNSIKSALKPIQDLFDENAPETENHMAPIQSAP